MKSNFDILAGIGMVTNDHLMHVAHYCSALPWIFINDLGQFNKII